MLTGSAAIMLAALMVLAALTSTMSVGYAQYAGTTSGGVGIASPEQLQECEQLDIPPENCNDLTIEAKKILTGAQGGTGNNSSSSISVTNVTSIIPNVTTTFQSNVDGFRVLVPSGWIIVDIDNTDPTVQQEQRSRGRENIAIICPQTETLPRIGGGYVCSTGPEQIHYVRILKFTDLQSRPEFAVLVRENKSITTSDFLAYFMQDLERRAGFIDFTILENIDRAVNITESQTNQTIATAPSSL